MLRVFELEEIVRGRKRDRRAFGAAVVVVDGAAFVTDSADGLVLMGCLAAPLNLDLDL